MPSEGGGVDFEQSHARSYTALWTSSNGTCCSRTGLTRSTRRASCTRHKPAAAPGDEQRTAGELCRGGCRCGRTSLTCESGKPHASGGGRSATPPACLLPRRHCVTAASATAARVSATCLWRLRAARACFGRCAPRVLAAARAAGSHTPWRPRSTGERLRAARAYRAQSGLRAGGPLAARLGAHVHEATRLVEHCGA